MWSVQTPVFNADDTYKLCISRIKNGDLKRRFRSACSDIDKASSDYIAKASQAELHLVKPSSNVGGHVTALEMSRLYDLRMAAKRSPGRPIYDAIKLLPKGDRCPYCDQRNISTVDHLLPKSLYPSLSVAPANLIGTCTDCNKIKSDVAPSCKDDVFLHPYYENIDSHEWLVAKVIESSPCALLFSTSNNSGMDSSIYNRLSRQFVLLGLSALYSSQAARETGDIRENLHTHFSAGGPAGVKSELERQWMSRKANRINSWQTATYKALYSNTWFCSGGFV